jgi:hypothetical protein
MRHFKPSTVSRRLSVMAGFYGTCVIDSVLEHSPVDYVRRPNVPPESPTLGLTHLQFEALLTAARNRPTTTTSRWSPCSGSWACASDWSRIPRPHPEATGRRRRPWRQRTPSPIQALAERAPNTCLTAADPLVATPSDATAYREGDR